MIVEQLGSDCGVMGKHYGRKVLDCLSELSLFTNIAIFFLPIYYMVVGNPSLEENLLCEA